ncbi:MAG: RNA methyltransferase [Acidobacteriaceae bacterium]|nr:RNA methyltransferase [Acidobacteriaceae bacterium]
MPGAVVGDGLRVVLVSPRNPLNIGAVARAMSNFGFRDLRLVTPYDVAFREAKSAVHSRYILESAQVHNFLPEAISDCGLVVGTTSVGHRDLHIPLYRLEAAGKMICQYSQSSPIALLFGSEKYGLSNENLSFCHWALRIPTREEHGSMNLGQAVAICLYELRRNDRYAETQFAPAPTASAEIYGRFTDLLLDLLSNSGYVNQKTSQSTELKIRRLVRRLHLPIADSETWLGILRQILWKVKQADPKGK